MTMKPGSSKTATQFSQSMGEAIENALKMEWLAVKGEALPDTGQDDRRLLFAAIAQGVLDYLKDRQDDFSLTWLGPFSATMEIEAPFLKLTPATGKVATSVKVKGEYFGPGKKVTVTWDKPTTSVLPATAAAQNTTTLYAGEFEGTFKAPSGAATGKHLVEARDEAGHVALAVFNVT